MALLPSILLAIGIMVPVGIAVIGVFVSVSTLLQSGAPDRYRGRVFAAYGTLAALAGTILGGVLGDLVGVTPMLVVAACLTIVAGIVALATLRGATSLRAQRGLVAFARPADEPALLDTH